MPEVYERLLVPTVFEPFALDMARRAAARGAQATLELAAGTGVVTRLLAAAGLTAITATDFNHAYSSIDALSAHNKYLLFGRGGQGSILEVANRRVSARASRGSIRAT